MSKRKHVLMCIFRSFIALLKISILKKVFLSVAGPTMAQVEFISSDYL